METPNRLYIERHIADHPLTKKIISRLPFVPVEFVDNYKSIGERKPLSLRAREDKNSLALAEKKGEVLKNIGRMESGQYYLFHEIDCKYDCEYCYLQYYFQTKVPIIFVNRDDVLLKIEEVLKSHPHPYFHVGEVCDALAFDPLTDFSLEISDLFSEYKHAVIEFRTKSTNIQNLLLLKQHPKNMIVSWTLSPERVVNAIEHKTPSLRERLDAARRCQAAGYVVGVRLDPVIIYEGWEEDYRGMVEEILIKLDPERIDYISLGTIKLHKLLIDAIRVRFPDSPTVTAELFPAVDGKYRYLKFQRVDVYRKIVSWIRQLDENVSVDLSIETDEVKELVFNSF
jgi:spore photoproduct lyase